MLTSPFKGIKFINVLNSDSYQIDLKKTLETLNFSRKNNDLYSLWQTDELNNCELKPVKEFINILATEIAPFLKNICNVDLNSKIIITASFYKHGGMSHIQ